jgi:hypothetical protein
MRVVSPRVEHQQRSGDKKHESARQEKPRRHGEWHAAREDDEQCREQQANQGRDPQLAPRRDERAVAACEQGTHSGNLGFAAPPARGQLVDLGSARVAQTAAAVAAGSNRLDVTMVVAAHPEGVRLVRKHP